MLRPAGAKDHLPALAAALGDGASGPLPARLAGLGRLAGTVGRFAAGRLAGRRDPLRSAARRLPPAVRASVAAAAASDVDAAVGRALRTAGVTR